jgi:hypothetical protein
MFAQTASGLVRAAVFAVALMACAPAAIGQQQPSAAAVSTARELIAVKGATGLYDTVIPGVVEQAKNLFLRTNPALAKDLNEVAAKLRTDFASRNSEIRDQVVKLYASHFTEQELKDALAFYKSSIGRKLIEHEPKILEKSMSDVQAWATKLSDEVVSKMRAEMKKKGHNI